MKTGMNYLTYRLKYSGRDYENKMLLRFIKYSMNNLNSLDLETERKLMQYLFDYKTLGYKKYVKVRNNLIKYLTNGDGCNE